MNHWLLWFFVYKNIKAYEQVCHSLCLNAFTTLCIICLQFIKKKCNNSIDQTIKFTFGDQNDPFIELTLSTPIPRGWKLHQHTHPLKVKCYTMSYSSLLVI